MLLKSHVMCYMGKSGCYMGCYGKLDRVSYLSEQRCMDILEFYYRDWRQIIRRHDSFPDQGSRRINRSNEAFHIPYGDDSWENTAYRATGL